MTPKEKAKDLFKKVDAEVCGDINHNNTKDMALLIIDEIIQTNPTIKGNSKDLTTMIIQTKAYWHQVAEEVKLL